MACFTLAILAAAGSCEMDDMDVFPQFLMEPVEDVAQQLLGCTLVRTLDGHRITVRIVETEAYDQDDPASHSFRGRTTRNEVMFGPGGYLYVYFTYGMHYCCNVVSGVPGEGSGVLIRAAQPIAGIDIIEARRGMVGVNATNGPAKLCQALDIDRSLGGHDLRREPLELRLGGLAPGETVARSPRIGISKATDRLRRFFLAGNPYVSRASGTGHGTPG
jgi:DNA-3-methyladenine glycosylase